LSDCSNAKRPTCLALPWVYKTLNTIASVSLHSESYRPPPPANTIADLGTSTSATAVAKEKHTMDRPTISARPPQARDEGRIRRSARRALPNTKVGSGRIERQYQRIRMLGLRHERGEIILHSLFDEINPGDQVVLIPFVVLACSPLLHVSRSICLVSPCGQLKRGQRGVFIPTCLHGKPDSRTVYTIPCWQPWHSYSSFPHLLPLTLSWTPRSPASQSSRSTDRPTYWPTDRFSLCFFELLSRPNCFYCPLCKNHKQNTPQKTKRQSRALC